MVGTHMTKTDWDNQATLLFSLYQQFCAQAQKLAGYLAPLTDQDVIDRTGYAPQDVVDLKSGVSVAKALADLSAVNGTPSTQQAQTASQAAVALGKFGGA